MALEKPDPATVAKTIVKLVALSLLVGWAITFFEITPEDIFRDFGKTLRAIYDAAKGAIEWSAGYIVIGAVVVIPIWLILTVINAFSGKRRRD